MDPFSVVNNFGVGLPTGFVARDFGSALITNFLANSNYVINPGLEVILYNGGDFWVRNTGSNAVTTGMKAYANYATGAITFAATGTPPTGAVVTGSIAINQSTSASIAVNQATGSIAIINGVPTLTVTGVTSGVIAAGQTITGTGVNVVTTVVAQLSGTIGGVGTYQVSVSQTTSSGLLTFSGGAMTVGATVTGTFVAGQTLTGSGVLAGQTIVSQISGTTGGTGVYYVSGSQTLAATTITASGATLTVSSVTSGVLANGNVITGSGILSGTYITSFGPNTLGLTGTYLLNNSQTVTATTISVLSGIETKFIAMSVGAAGELIKISDHANG